MEQLAASSAVSASPLRDALIDAAMDLLRDGGRQGLTLRKAAALAGVSHAAPAHHFGNLEGLLAAVAGRGFELFADSMERALEQADPAPYARLRALLHAYLGFARTHQGLFEVMFRTAERDEILDPRQLAANERSKQLLMSVSAPFARSPQEGQALALNLWALAHGYAFLLSAGQVPEGAPQAPDAALFAMIAEHAQKSSQDA